MRLRGASGRSNPGANVYLEGAVPAGIVVPAHGSHLHKQATRVRQIPTAEAASLPDESSIVRRESSTLIHQAKVQMRRAAQARRDALHATESVHAAAGLCDHGLRLIAGLPGETVSGFWPIRSEPDLRPLLSGLVTAGRQIALPVIVAPGLPLCFRRWDPGDTLVTGAFGTAYPPPDQPELVPEIMLVPLLAFDRKRRRLGYGGGFYDRTIAGLRTAGHTPMTIGVGYAGLEVAEVPVDPWDETLDAILTERGPV